MWWPVKKIPSVSPPRLSSRRLARSHKKIPSVSPPRLSSRRDGDRRRRHPRAGFPSLCPSPPALRRARWPRTVASSSRDAGVLAPSTGARRNPRYLFLTVGGGGEAHRLHPIGAPSWNLSNPLSLSLLSASSFSPCLLTWRRTGRLLWGGEPQHRCWPRVRPPCH